MKMQLTEIDAPWFISPADDKIVMESTTYGVYQITWNGVTVGSVHLFSGQWICYTPDGEMFSGVGTPDPARAAVAVCDRWAATEVDA